MSYSAKNLQWNIVDVRGADGLLHLGRVTDCALEGLMVDFGCGNGIQLVPFGQIYHSDLSELELDEDLRAGAESLELLVDILIRLGSDQPIKWYPGVRLTEDSGGYRSFVVVRAATPNGTLVDIVPVEHVRKRHSEERLHQFVLEKGQYAKEEIQLPSGICGASPSPGPYKTAPADQHLVDCFNKHCWGKRMLATHIDGGILHVLKVTDRYHWTFDRDYPGHSCSKIEGERLLRMLNVLPGTLPASNLAQRKRFGSGEDRASAPKKLLSETLLRSNLLISSGDQSSLSSSTLNQSLALRASLIEVQDDGNTAVAITPINNVLPKEVLAEIFAFLDGMVQVKLHRVCSSWNHILNAAPVIRMLRLPEKKDSIAPLFCMLKRWTTETKIIVSTTMENFQDDWEGKMFYGSLLCSGRLFRLVIQERQFSRLETLVLANISWEWASRERPTCYFDRINRFGNFVNHLCQQLNFLASVCHNLVLKNITVSVALAEFTRATGYTSDQGMKSVIVYITKGRIEGKLSVQNLWSRMDSSLPKLTSADVDHWKKSIADITNLDLLEQLVEILNGHQSTDPRDNNQFYGKVWSAEHLNGLDLHKLSRITSHSLLKACRHGELVIMSGMGNSAGYLKKNWRFPLALRLPFLG